MIAVKPGAESAGVDIQLAGVPFVRVSGRVVGMPQGAPEAYVTLSSREIGGAGSPLKPDGSFELWGLDPGKYRLFADWQAPGGQETTRGSRVSTAAVEIEVAESNVDNLELRVVPDSEIAGRLESEGDTPPAPHRSVTLRQAGTAWTIGPPAEVDADNTFRFEKVPAGKYDVGLSWDSAYVSSMRLGPAAIDGAVLDVSNGSGGADLVLRLSPATGSVSGTVRDDRGNAAEARVALILDGEHSAFAPRFAKAKTDGAYSFVNLPPGNYKMLAVPEDDADLILQESTEFEDVMDKVEIHDGDKVSLDLKRRTTTDQ
jgi:hypothetical protein